MESDAAQEILIGLLHHPLTALGPGRRVGIWTQGCSIRCPSCISRHSWDTDRGERLSVESLLERIGPQLTDCDGVTVSGGEPFDQPAALAQLIEGLRRRGIADILLYSGYRAELLQERHPRILERIAALVDGEFIRGCETNDIWKGSDNQRLITFTPDSGLQERYRTYAACPATERRLQVIGTNGTVMVVGIPRQGDLEAMYQ